MPESPETLYARIVEQVGPDGRLPAPTTVHAAEGLPWEIVEGELLPRVVSAPVSAEQPRAGAGGDNCALCAEPEGVRIWESWNFHVLRPAQPAGLPLVLQLNSNEHMDFTEMTDDLAAEFGRLQVWLARIMCNLPHIGRVHVNRWGENAEHLHMWFHARPAGFETLRGSMAFVWDQTLPAVDREIWEADTVKVAHKLAFHDGHALV